MRAHSKSTTCISFVLMIFQSNEIRFYFILFHFVCQQYQRHSQKTAHSQSQRISFKINFNRIFASFIRSLSLSLSGSLFLFLFLFLFLSFSLSPSFSFFSNFFRSLSPFYPITKPYIFVSNAISNHLEQFLFLHKKKHSSDKVAAHRFCAK